MSRQSEHLTESDCVSFTVRYATQYTINGFAWSSWSLQGSVMLTYVKAEQRVEVSYTVGGQTLRQHIALLYTLPRFGGRRWWFRCPDCRRRVGRLFLPVNGGRRFLCRHCYRLRYRSQRQTPEWRAHDKADKIKKRLGGEAGPMTPFPDKPRGMHVRTYLRHLRAWEAAEAEWDSGMTRRLVGRFTQLLGHK